MVNDHGIIIDPHTTDFESGNAYASIRVGHDNDKYYESISYMLSWSGYGSAPSVCSTAYDTFEAAYDVAETKLIEHLNRNSDQKEYKGLLNKIMASKQHSLF